jgi:hypothetical protein
MFSIRRATTSRDASPSSPARNRHEALAVGIAQQAAVAAAAFGDQDARRKDGGRMEQGSLHVPQVAIPVSSANAVPMPSQITALVVDR